MIQLYTHNPLKKKHLKNVLEDGRGHEHRFEEKRGALYFIRDSLPKNYAEAFIAFCVVVVILMTIFS